MGMSLKINVKNTNQELIDIEKNLIGRYGNPKQPNDGKLINNAIQKAVESWQNRLDSQKNVVVNIKLVPNSVPNALMDADSQQASYSYSQVVNALKNSQKTSLNDSVALSSLQRKSVATQVSVNSALAKSLGLIIDPTNTAIDATIRIGNNVPWYLNTENAQGNSDQSTKDFTGALTHEIGHALGFDSNVDNPGDPPKMLDLFRYTQASRLTSSIDLLVDPKKTYYLSLDQGTTPEATLSRGLINKVGFQAAHFTNFPNGIQSGGLDKKRNIASQFIQGIMAPEILPRTDARVNFDLTPNKNPVVGKVVPGVTDRITKKDLIVMDVIGWDLKDTANNISDAAKKNKKAPAAGIKEDKLLAKNYIASAGDDSIVLDVGNSTTLYGDAGYDVIQGSSLKDIFYGGTEDDQMFGNEGNDILLGEAGDDQIFGGLGNDSLYGGIGDDLVQGNEGDDFMQGNEGLDILDGGDGNDSVSGGADDDVVAGNNGNDTLLGGEGNDILDGGLGADVLDGGNGDDNYVIDNALDTIVNETATSGYDAVSAEVSFNLPNEIENLVLTGLGNTTGAGNSLNNILVGNAQKNILNGLGGDDDIYGDAGDDTLKGGAGNDYLNGNGSGLFGQPSAIDSDRLEGGIGDDLYVVDSGDTVIENPGEGNDKVLASFSYVLPSNVEGLILLDQNVILDPISPTSTGLAAKDSPVDPKFLAEGVVDNPDGVYQNIDATGNELNNAITGSNGKNILNGAAGDDTLDGSGGDDQIYGEVGNDSLSGGSGNDRMNGNQGNDRMAGGIGNDALWGDSGNDLLQGDEGIDTLVGGDGDDTLEGGADRDELYGDGGNDLINGGSGNDQINGNDGNDTIIAGEDQDLVFGDGGNDFIQGNEGKDTLYGGDGEDTLVGGSGEDALTGGGGRDRFQFNSPGQGVDTIMDYQSGVDKIQIQLSGFSAIKTTSGLPIQEFRSVADDKSAELSNGLLVFSRSSGKLIYNQNGAEAGLGSGSNLAIFNNGVLLGANDLIGI
jgi:Ca2+-binding RTX toxin-like protein